MTHIEWAVQANLRCNGGPCTLHDANVTSGRLDHEVEMIDMPHHRCSANTIIRKHALCVAQLIGVTARPTHGAFCFTLDPDYCLQLTSSAFQVDYRCLSLPPTFSSEGVELKVTTGRTHLSCGIRKRWIKPTDYTLTH